MAQLRAIIDRPLVDPVLYHAGIHPDLKAIITKALSKDPSQRYLMLKPCPWISAALVGVNDRTISNTQSSVQ